MIFYPEKLKAIRKKQGLSQKDLADRSRKEEFSFSKPAVSAWENSRKNPKSKHIITLAKILNVKTTDISDFDYKDDSLLAEYRKHVVNADASDPEQLKRAIKFIHSLSPEILKESKNMINEVYKEANDKLFDKLFK